MALFPKRVDLDEASLTQLRQLFEEATSDLRGIVFHVGGQDVTVVNVQEARSLVRQRIERLSNQASAWAAQNVRQTYDAATQQLIDQLKSFQHPATDAVALALLAGVAATIHGVAVETQITTLSTNLVEAAAQMGRSTDKTVASLLHQSIRDKLAAPEAQTSQAAARRQVLKAFDENGITALVDRAGKRWAPETYAEMASKTVLAQTSNMAVTNSLGSQQYDLVRVSAHGAKDECGPFEGSILSLTGATPGYLTMTDAANAGLFHVNCGHTIAPLEPDEYPPEYLKRYAPTELPLDV